VADVSAKARGSGRADADAICATSCGASAGAEIWMRADDSCSDDGVGETAAGCGAGVGGRIGVAGMVVTGWPEANGLTGTAIRVAGATAGCGTKCGAGSGCATGGTGMCGAGFIIGCIAGAESGSGAGLTWCAIAGF
jgi:hypothetical protein